MLTKEENERLSRVGPGTPAGELLRRYWFPVAYVQELTDEQPTRFVRILGEDLVLFRDKSGNVGLLGDHCAHRGASLLYGRVEERGIACAYHGWLYNTRGHCLETPAEPADSMFHLTVKQKAYPVQKFIGMYWAYLGPLPAPYISKYDLWVRRDGRRRHFLQPILDANWLQASENSVDPAHGQILHADLLSLGVPVTNTTRGLIDLVAKWEFFNVPYGIVKRRTYTDGVVDEHPFIFPNILRQATQSQIRVPVDDTHTKIFFVRFDPTEDGGLVDEADDLPVKVQPAYKDPADQLHPLTRFDMKLDVQSQDHMAWETQGPIVDRSAEHLATSDRGVQMLRQLLKEQIERVERGLDPMGVQRDPDHAMIDTMLDVSLEEIRIRQERGQAVIRDLRK